MTESQNPYLEAVARLDAEGRTLEQLVENLSDSQWRLDTPAQGWTIAHQIAHLAWTDQAALTALQGQEAFQPLLEASQAKPLGLVNEAADEGAKQPPQQLLEYWRSGREQLAQALKTADQNQRYPWFGPPMKPRSMVTARIMETWAHGQDVAQTLGTHWPASAALQDIAHLGIATRNFSYHINELAPPETPMYVQLTGPNDETWEWGDPEAENRITGSAWDFALLVTQRAELEELDLAITGSDAQTWASFAQAFAGPPKSVVRAQQNAPVAE